MSLYKDLFVRDTWDDNGTEPIVDAYVACSPDVIPYAQSTLSSSELISTYTSRQLLHKEIVKGCYNYIYVRAKNNAPGATNGKLSLYYAPANLLVQPSLWKRNIIRNNNSTNYANLTATSNNQVVPGDQPFYFAPPSSLNTHFCFLACIEKNGQPSPIPSNDFARWQDFIYWVQSHANVCWHNANIIKTLSPEGHREALEFNNIGQQDYHGFTVKYQNLPVGAVLRIYALADQSVNFTGFNTSITITAEHTTSQIGAGAIFPGNYTTTIFTTCIFPGTLPPNYIITTTSLGYIAPEDYEEFRDLQPLFLKNVPKSISNLKNVGSYVPIASFTSYYISSIH